MAQVYKFIDGNGETRLLTEISPDPAFTGGDIVGPLHVGGTGDANYTLSVESLTASGAGDAFIITDSFQDPVFWVITDQTAGLDHTVRIGGQISQNQFVDGTPAYMVAVQGTHTAEIIQALNAGVKVFRVLAGGAVVIAQHAAPADGDLAAGDCALWFDQTNGAAALNIKAKQADGTVKTATIPVIT